MLNICTTKECESIFRFFEEISKIPHTSGNTKGIADYLVKFANERALFVYRDSYDNVIIRKSATKGYEDRPTLILQGHTDMVEAKRADVKKDMLTEGLDLYVDGDYIRAEGTTLGGDDGVAVAYALAILDSKTAEHPEIEALFTSDEETGLIGATNLDASNLRGRTMINIDSDEEGVFTVGCAGGVRVDIELQAKRAELNDELVTLEISGLLGGHSGIEIGKGRTNAIKLLADILSSLEGVKICALSGGNADNAIPRNAKAIFVCNGGADAVKKEIADRVEKLKETEPGVNLALSKKTETAKAFDNENSVRIISLLSSLPNGVVKMSEDIEGLVETSLNTGILKSDDSGVQITLSIRSSKDEEKAKVRDTVLKTAAEFGATASARSEYPGWAYKKDSRLREIMCRIYKDMYGKEAEVVAIHAGLECGIFASKISGLDCISIGPENHDIHTPDEALSISSTVRVFEFILEVLKNI